MSKRRTTALTHGVCSENEQRRHRCSAFVRTPRPPGLPPHRLDRLGRCQLPVAERPARQTESLCRDFNCPAKENALGGVRANVRVSDSRKISIRRTDDSDRGNVEIRRSKFFDEVAQPIRRDLADALLERLNCGLRFGPRQLHDLVVRLTRCGNLRIHELDSPALHELRTVSEGHGDGLPRFRAKADRDVLR